MPPPPRRGQRIAAGIVAFVVFGAAAALAIGAFRSPGTTAAASPDPTTTVVVRLGSAGGPQASLEFDDQTAEPQIGSYCWNGTSRCVDSALVPFAVSDFVDVPIGTPIALVGDDTLTKATATIERGTDPMDVVTGTRLLPSPIDAVDEPAGRYVLIIDARWPQGSVEFYFPIEVTGAAQSSAPPEGSFLTAALDAPTDGSTPALILSEPFRSGRFHPNDGRWPGATLSPSPQQAFEGRIDPGTTLKIYGDADHVEGRLLIVDKEQQATGESIPLDLSSGTATLPNHAGYFQLTLVGTWPQGSVGFNIAITVGSPSADWPPPAPIAVVPNVIGLDEHDAVARLTAAGSVSVSVASPADGSTGVVASSDPPAGTSTVTTTTIMLTVSANR